MQTMSRRAIRKGRETNQVLLHLLDRFCWDRQTELLLGDGKVEPELTPSAEASLCESQLGVKRQASDARSKRRASPFPPRHSEKRACSVSLAIFMRTKTKGETDGV